ncbi:MAG: hypothetical protein ACK4TA_15385 [Saprospiraceae bacterium]
MKTIPTKIWLPLMALILLLVVTIWISANNELTTTENEATSTEQTTNAQPTFAKLSVQAPLQNVTVPQEAVVVQDPSQPAVLTLTSGSKIEIPANAFVNKKGEIITSPVTIHFKEYHDAAEIIASGIPMRVQKAHGAEDWMQTAGMFEITGTTNHEPVQIAQGKSLNISLVSKVDGAYDFWYFDEQQGNWENLAPNILPENNGTLPNTPQPALEAEISRLKRATATLPQEPVYDALNNLAFPDLDVKRCQNLQNKGTLILNYAGTDEKLAPKNNKWITKPGIWTKKRLECSNDPELFTLTLIGDTIYQIPVRLAPQPADLARAKAQYEAQLAEFKANQQLLREKESILKQQASFRRSMEVENFGIHNYDILLSMKDAVPLLAEFDFGNYPEDMKELITVYLITGQGRTVINLPYYNWDKFRFLPSADNKLVAVLPGNKVALFTENDFKQQLNDLKKAAGKSYTFKMRIENQEVRSITDLNKYIKKASS